MSGQEAIKGAIERISLNFEDALEKLSLEIHDAEKYGSGHNPKALPKDTQSRLKFLLPI